MSKTRKAKGVKADLIASATGKHIEPTWNLLAPPAKIDLIKALNSYNQNYDAKKLREWTLKYIKDHKHPNTDAAKAPLFMFTTEATLLRMSVRGMILTDEQDRLVRNWLNALGPIRDLDSDEDEAPKPKRQKKSSVDFNMQAFDDAMDALSAPEFDAAKSMKGVVAYCAEQLQAIKDEPKAYPKDVREWIKAMHEKAVQIESQTKFRVVTKRKPRKKDPAKIVAKVQYQKTDATLKLTSLNPKDVLGKKKLYIYDTKLRKLKKITAIAEGFTFKGTTLMNVDLSKSAIKTVRKPERDLTGTVEGIRALDRVFNGLTGKGSEIKTAIRMNANSILLGAS